VGVGLRVCVVVTARQQGEGQGGWKDMLLTPGCVCLTQGMWRCCGCAAWRPFVGARRQGRSERAGADMRVSGKMCGDGCVLVVGRAVWPSEQARVGAWGS
jgi:hypothetical protein